MDNNLLSQYIIGQYKEQEFQSFQQRFEHYQQTIARLMEHTLYADFHHFIGNYSEEIIKSPDVLGVLKYYFDMESTMQQQCPQNLAVLYLMIGHCYFFTLNNEEAKNYYYLATSYAMEYNDYAVLSLCANNLNCMQFDNVPDEIIFENSKMPANLFILSKSEKKDLLMSRFIAHIELAINLNKLDYAIQFYERHFSFETVDRNSRLAIQLLTLKGYIVFAKQDYEGALLFYNELLTICMEQKIYKDLILVCFDRIVLCYENLKKEQLIPNILDEKQRAFGELKVDFDFIGKYVSGKNNTDIQKNYPSIHTKEEFETFGRHHSSDTTGEGVTLIVVDLMVHQENQKLVASIIELLEKEMQQQFAPDLIASTQLNDTTLGYLVKLSETVCNERCAKIKSLVRTQFPENQAVLQSIYFSSVNNKEHDLFHFEKMRDLAFALIYYALYK